MPLRPHYYLVDKDGNKVKPTLGHRSLRNKERAKQALRDENPDAVAVMQNHEVIWHKTADGRVLAGRPD